MADNTKIEWADATLNYLNGCSVLSPGCTNCYAMKLAGTRLKHTASREGLTRPGKAGPVWTGEVRPHVHALMQALAWKRGRRIFWNAHGDIFHENVLVEWIDRLFAVCAMTPQHTHMILTKRSGRMRQYVSTLPNRDDLVAQAALLTGAFPSDADKVMRAVRMPLANVWLGVSVEDQRRADERVPDLLATPAAVRFLSCEPLLGPVELGCIEPRDWRAPMGWAEIDMIDAAKGEGWVFDEDGEIDKTVGTAKLDWVIAGGESGPGARPMNPDWARSLRDQCEAAGVAFHFKQWGEWGHALHMEGCHGVAAALTGTGHWPEPKRYRVIGGPLDRKAFESHPSDHLLLRVGKKAAGRALDGRFHDSFPFSPEGNA